MITKITPHIFLGEWPDAVDNIGALVQLGITTVLNVMEISDPREEEMLKNAWNTSKSIITYVWSPVQVDCTDCQIYKSFLAKKISYSPEHCDKCPNNINNLNPEKKNKFLQGLEIAVHALSAILSKGSKEKVLVHCTAGIDRSQFVVAKYLADIVKTVPVLSQSKEAAFDFIDVSTLPKAYAFIQKKRPWICEHYEWAWWE